MALDWTNKINNVDNVDANDVNTLAAAIKDVEQSVTTEDGKLTDHKTKAVLDHPDSSVTTDKIANGAVSTDKIAPNAVTGSRIANNSVTGTKIADGAVTTSKIGKNAVGTDNIKDAAVDSAKIANGSIAARHIIDGQVTRDKIAADSISSDKLANKSVTTEKINDGAVTTEKIEDNAITTSKIADGEISEAKLDTALSEKINGKANSSDVYTKAEADTKLGAKENIANKVTEISDTSTDVQYPSAKAVNDVVSAQKTDVVQNYANALKGKVSGNNAVRIDDSSPIEHEMNVRVSSKNLIPYPYAFFKGKPTYTESGLTLTDNGDGTITANGTLTKNTSFKLYENITLNYQGIVIQSYKGLINNGYVYVHNATDNITHMGGESFELYFDHKYASSVVIIAGEYDNVTFKPQLERGNVITDYTPYIAPSSVTLSETGKNLILYPYANTTKTLNGVTFTDNGDGSVTINGTATANTSFSFSENLPINLSSIYTLSKNVPNIYFYIAYYKNNSYVGEKAVSGSLSSALVDLTTIDCDRARCAFQIPKGTTISKAILKPQLELGSTNTVYEKYVPRKTFTPSADGTVTGVKNIYPTTTLLANKDNVIIDVEYNRDINKAFEELQNAILAQGSNT